ncbi:hypothetical protein CHARACLAT_027337 [Characodon lateralis]|uniref:Uncharacterized protein n=1 Tax=Characodon lateralis TaxID=208331 RepID=A0ABU7DKC0_9TELE|nr:hypothetical protein [Characodon lateralis]
MDIKLTSEVHMSVIKLSVFASASSRLRVCLKTWSNDAGNATSEKYLRLGTLYYGLKCCMKFLKSQSSTTENGWSSNAMNSVSFLVVTLLFSLLVRANNGPLTDSLCMCRYDLVGGSVSQPSFMAEQNGDFGCFQTSLEVDKIGFTCRYRPIADHPKIMRMGPIYWFTPSL